jgi:hypothetical protein
MMNQPMTDTLALFYVTATWATPGGRQGRRNFDLRASDMTDAIDRATKAVETRGRSKIDIRIVPAGLHDRR